MKNFGYILLVTLTFMQCKKNKEKSTENVENYNVAKNEMVAVMHKTMENMHAAKITGNNDADFAKMMIEHHKGAIDMAKLQLSKGKDSVLRAFSEKVMEDQGKEIDEMLKFVNKTEVSANSKEFLNASNASMSAMMNKNIPVHNDADKDFAQQMIPHHQSAVEMAKAYLRFGKNAELIKLCNDIVKNQNNEILVLQQWLNSKQ